MISEDSIKSMADEQINRRIKELEERMKQREPKSPISEMRNRLKGWI
jgi:predicted metal-dependent hydrolase